ncbi:MAG: parvulin peptidyl-prolyl isomerase, partial [Chlorobi bacterium]|nr:parvulin peptidyl-prolyl isomerase [Chlorobiota bacterium]
MKSRLLLVWLLLLVLIPGIDLRAQSEHVVDCIVAVVGGDIITKSEVEMQALQAAVQTKRSPNDPLLLNKVLEAMINDKLVLAQAELDSIVVAEDEVTQRLDMQLKYLERQYGSRKRLEQAAGMPMSQIRREFREDVRKRIMIERLQQQEFGSIEVSRREVEEFYNTYRDSLPLVPEMVELRQIVRYPKVTEDYKEQARRRAEALLDSLRAGADFKELARKYSEDIGSARNGGDLGLVRRGLLVKEFEEAAYALEPGEISNVVETKFGFHIIKMLERKGEAIHPLQILIKIKVTGSSDSLAINLLKEL